MQKQNRYYEVGETVFLRGSKKLATIKKLNIVPNKKIYKAIVEVTENTENGGEISRALEVNLWDIDKDKRGQWKKSTASGLDKIYFQVRDFHKAFGHPVSYIPTRLTQERANTRSEWLSEEVGEFVEAKTLVGQVDAMIDLIYFAVGTLVEMGVKPDRLVDIVHKANMGKLHDIDGELKPVYREDGKIVKPERWEDLYAPEPKMSKEIERQIENQTKYHNK